MTDGVSAAMLGSFAEFSAPAGHRPLASITAATWLPVAVVLTSIWPPGAV